MWFPCLQIHTILFPHFLQLLWIPCLQNRIILFPHSLQISLSVHRNSNFSSSTLQSAIIPGQVGFRPFIPTWISAEFSRWTLTLTLSSAPLLKNVTYELTTGQTVMNLPFFRCLDLFTCQCLSRRCLNVRCLNV